MAGLKEIKRRLVSVKNTKKITYAMKLVAAAKLRKAQESVTRSRAYSEALKGLLLELSEEKGALDFEHPLMSKRDSVKKVRLLVIGGSRGLCGGYNTNINKKAEAFFKQYSQGKSVQVESVLVCRKPAEYYRRVNRPFHKSYENLAEDANIWPIDEICRELENDFIKGEVDEVYMIYTKFKSALSMTVMAEKILPMESEINSTAAGTSATGRGVTLFEPGPAEVFSELIPRILRTRVRQASLDAKASEYGSRMTAMEAATKNAGGLVHSLTLTANKLRQSQITSQLLDILNGADASK